MCLAALIQATKDLDVRILRELTSPDSFQWNFRQSYAAIGKNLGAAPETVRVTLNRAVKLGLIQKWRLVVNPELFSCKIAGVQLAVGRPERKLTMISQLQLVDGVFLMLVYHGAGLKLHFYFEDELALGRRLALIRSICEQKTEVASWVLNMPPCRLKMDRLDWEIVQDLLHDPRKESTDVAEKIGVSKRTVNRRLKMMTERTVATLVPVRNVRNRKGTLCNFLIFGSERGQKASKEVLKSLGVRVDFLTQLSEDKIGLIFESDNPSEAKELYNRLKIVDGVSRVVMDLIEDYIFVDDWLDQMVARRAAEHGT